MKLLVRNLTRKMSEHEVRVLFTTHGSVSECTLVLDQNSGQSKGFAFVEMADDKEARVAIAALNMTSVAGNIIRVKKAKP